MSLPPSPPLTATATAKPAAKRSRPAPKQIIATPPPLELEQPLPPKPAAKKRSR
jgi:hypothetical protein